MARSGRRKASQPGRTVARVIVASLLSLGVLTGLGVVLVYNHWNSNVDQVPIGDQVKDRPAAKTKAINVLVMGSDTRTGKGNGIDGESGGGLSDTTMLFHLSADRKFAYGISIPRDSAVMRPTCYREDGSEIAATTGYVKWNEAFAAGGPFCTIQQFEQLTDIRIDNYLLVDFNQFKDMVDALDGVEICLPQDIDDDERNVHLKAGTRVVDGEEALAYVRVRYGISGGIDPNRTRRQQAFIGSMISRALTAGILTRPDKLVSFMNAATSSLQTNFKNIGQMADLGLDARKVGADNIKFVTTPWIYSDKVSSGVEWTKAVDRLWALVIADKPLSAEFRKDALSASDEPDGASTDPSPDVSGSGTPDGSSSGTTDEATDPAAPGGSDGLSTSGREAAGLCT